MADKLLISLVFSGLSAVCSAQVDDDTIRALENRQADNRTVIGGGHSLLAAGADAIRFGKYDDGIQLTLLGLDRASLPDSIRAAGLSNLCAAHAGKNEPDLAIRYCNDSLELNEHNWQAWSNRSYAYWLKGMYAEATLDLEAAMAINSDARQLFEIRGMLNEAGLRPRVSMEDHQ